MGKVQGMAAPKQLMAAILQSQGGGQQLQQTVEEPVRQSLVLCDSKLVLSCVTSVIINVLVVF